MMCGVTFRDIQNNLCYRWQKGWLWKGWQWKDGNGRVVKERAFKVVLACVEKERGYKSGQSFNDVSGKNVKKVTTSEEMEVCV